MCLLCSTDHEVLLATLIQAEKSGTRTNMECHDARRASIKTVTKITKWMCQFFVQCLPASIYVKPHQRLSVKYHSSCAHSSMGLCHVVVIEEQGCTLGIHKLVVTSRDIIPPNNGGSHQTCPVRSDKTDGDSQVGKFYVKKDQANTMQESGYCSAVLVPGSVPPPSQQTHTSAEQATVKEESITESSKAEVDNDLEDKRVCFEAGATSHSGSNTDMLCCPEDNANIFIAERDGGAAHSEHIIDRHCSASAAEKNESAKSSDDEADGHYPNSCLQGRDKDSALGFPTPASLEEGTPQDIHHVKSIGMAGFSEASSLPPAVPPQHPSPSAQQSLPLNSPTLLGPSPVHQGNNNELLQSISYTTSSFQKRAELAKATKEEPQDAADTTLARYVSKQDITSPKQGIVSSTTLATRRHRGLPEVHNAPGLNEGSGDVTLTTHAVSETSAGKRMDSLCVVVPHVLLPPLMKAGLTIRSPNRYAM